MSGITKQIQLFSVAVVSLTAFTIALFPASSADAATRCTLNTYRYRDSHACVRYIQAMSPYAYGPKLYIDGNYGMLTVQAIRTVQLANVLVVDGVTGAQTWKTLCKGTYQAYQRGSTYAYQLFVGAGC